MTSSSSSSSASSSSFAAGCDLAGGAKSEGASKRAGGRASERRGSAPGKAGVERVSLSVSASFLPSFAGWAFIWHSLRPRSGVTPRFFPRTLLSSYRNTARGERGHFSEFGCYLRNFWRAVARYFLSVQSQAAHCCWFLAVSGCCFLPPSLPSVGATTTSAKALAPSAPLASPAVGAATAGLAPAALCGGAPWGSRRLSGRCGGGGAGGVVAVQEEEDTQDSIGSDGMLERGTSRTATRTRAKKQM